jgi:hypothetical protein
LQPLRRHGLLDRERLAEQPRLGLAGLAFAAAVFVVLAFGAGDVQSSLAIFGPLATFALPTIAMIAFWWDDWPGSTLRAPLSGLVDTGLVVAGAVVLTIAGQGIVERVDLRGVFTAAPGAEHAPTFPVTLPLAGAAFAAMLQLTLVCEGWPLQRLGRVAGGVAALAVSWAVALAAFLLLVSYDDVPAAAQAASGLHDPGGPVPAADFGAALIAVGVWQALLFIAWHGWPFASWSRRSARLLGGNAAVIGVGALTYLALRELAGWEPSAIAAACGCAIAAVLLVGMLFDGWPASGLTPALGRLAELGLVALVAIALDRALAAYADGVEWTEASPDDWVATAALTFLGAGVILHVAVGRRWPLALMPTSDEGTMR